MSLTGEGALHQQAGERSHRGLTGGVGADDPRAKERVLALAASLVGASTLLGLASRAVGGTAGPAAAVVGGIVTVACALTLRLVRRRRLAVASWLFLVVAWSMISAISVTRGGL